jgi:hypothetical protein
VVVEVCQLVLNQVDRGVAVVVPLPPQTHRPGLDLDIQVQLLYSIHLQEPKVILVDKQYPIQVVLASLALVPAEVVPEVLVMMPLSLLHGEVVPVVPDIPGLSI